PAQINPHFLFHTLNLIATLFRIDPAKARELTIQLADYMRFNLNTVSKSLIILEREIKHLEAHIEIRETRYSQRSTINLKIEPDMSHVLTSPSTIQPNVENAVEHGLNNVTKNGQISVIIKRKNDMIKISVEDNGIGFTKEELNKLAKHRKSETSNGG